jgi:hypothetical protein
LIKTYQPTSSAKQSKSLFLDAGAPQLTVTTENPDGKKVKSKANHAML